MESEKGGILSPISGCSGMFRDMNILLEWYNIALKDSHWTLMNCFEEVLHRHAISLADKV